MGVTTPRLGLNVTGRLGRVIAEQIGGLASAPPNKLGRKGREIIVTTGKESSNDSKEWTSWVIKM